MGKKVIMFTTANSKLIPDAEIEKFMVDNKIKRENFTNKETESGVGYIIEK